MTQMTDTRCLDKCKVRANRTASHVPAVHRSLVFSIHILLGYTMVTFRPPVVFEKKTAGLVEACLEKKCRKRSVGTTDDSYLV